MHVKRGERPDNPFKVIEIEIKSIYCSFKIKMISYSWRSQAILRIRPIPMLDRMPISSTTLDHYFKLSKIDVDTIKTLHEIIPNIGGIMDA